jgi:hypothetical protein
MLLVIPNDMGFQYTTPDLPCLSPTDLQTVAALAVVMGCCNTTGYRTASDDAPITTSFYLKRR